MERTPEKPPRPDPACFAITADESLSPRRSTRVKKPPPITPRRFTRFFTPRSTNARSAVRTSRAALQDLSGPALNRRRNAQHHRHDGPGVFDRPRSNKKRKFSTTSAVSSLPSSPIKKHHGPPDSQEQPNQNGDEQLDGGADTGAFDVFIDSEDEERDRDGGSPSPSSPLSRRARILPPIVQYRSLGTSASVLSTRLSGRQRVREPRCSRLWQHETADFFSSPDDVNGNQGAGSPVVALPFCATSCKTNPLVAIGDEEGSVKLVDSANADGVHFSETYLTMRPHDNAIMDMEFSSDDSFLATASGDQTCHVIDMRTQTSLYCLTGHTSSIKRVQFQPGSGNNVLATCARDGVINFYDLRCSNNDRPSFHLRTMIPTPMSVNIRQISFINSIRDAHRPTWKSKKTRGRTAGMPIPGRDDFTVTSLAFINEVRPHLLVTTSDNDAIVKLWDMRTTYRRSTPNPVSCTREPTSHEHHRSFGLTALAMSSDSSRIYTLCRDHHIYTYSTSHLIIGDAPELSQPSSRPFRPTASDPVRQGLGPLYGFRHPSLRVSTFYPRLAVRKCSDSDCELLAAGSSDDCAVLFPTNERYLTKHNQMALGSPVNPDISIYNHGTALIRGHEKEVTAVTWTSEGNLVTAADDFTVRCWREDAARARDCRVNGEQEGRRWQTGWADVLLDGYDQED